MFDGRWRTSVEQGVKPVGSALRRIGVTADHLTATGLAMAVATSVAIATGHLAVGFILLVLAAVPDLLDGAVAKASGTASSRGAFFDSVADRVTDSLLLGGIAWHLAVTDGGLTPLLPMAVLGTSTLISYERAKADALGYDARGGLMERAERIIAIAAALAFPILMIPVLWLMLALTSLTAVQRFVKVWRQASIDRPQPPRHERALMGERWRAWRAQTSDRDWRAGARWHAVRERRRTSTRRSAGTRRP
ncbi:MAG TPA: CDP-alcohol phosphatidyltransferase family protein [Acidimicrobiales bacterium]